MTNMRYGEVCLAVGQLVLQAGSLLPRDPFHLNRENPNANKRYQLAGQPTTLHLLPGSLLHLLVAGQVQDAPGNVILIIQTHKGDAGVFENMILVQSQGHQSKVVDVVSAPALNKSRQVSSSDSWSKIGFSPFSPCNQMFASTWMGGNLCQEDVKEVPGLVHVPRRLVLLDAITEHGAQLADYLYLGGWHFIKKKDFLSSPWRSSLVSPRRSDPTREERTAVQTST